ncbi:MAG TPA: hypothetical protein VNR38_12225 [Ureibacillus sp.]|nr:hypothetical protein [Ureibacillus sp.]
MSVLKAELSRHPAWIVAAVLLCISGPFIAILTPVILTVTTYQYSSRISYVPLPSSYRFYLSAFIFTGVVLVFIYFLSKKSFKVTLGILASCLFIVLFYSGVNQYHYFDRDYIEIGGIVGKTQYSWSDVEEAVIVVDSSEYRTLHLKMNDSKEIEILLAGVVNSKAEMSIRNRLAENNVEVIYAE